MRFIYRILARRCDHPSSDEQSRGIVQVSQAISEMDKVTQQNASLVEERPRRRLRLKNRPPA
ncbi:hypothetical protein A3219_07295 [Salmonella enterica]|nr:hypothetical protein A3219_07295 [Salmonella enterica]